MRGTSSPDARLLECEHSQTQQNQDATGTRASDLLVAGCALHRHDAADEIITFCRQRLAHYKCPDTLEFGPLPKTSTGKVQKFALREREWTGRETRVGTT